MTCPALLLRLASPISGVGELRIRGFKEPTLFSKGGRDSVLGRYTGLTKSAQYRPGSLGSSTTDPQPDDFLSTGIVK